jgi:hypothetical protein
MVYVGSDNGAVYAFTTSGQQAWVRNVGIAVSSSPAIGPDGSVWIAAQNGVVYRFHAIAAPPPPGTAPPGTRTATPLPTAVPSVTAASGPTATVTVPATSQLSFTVKSKVGPGLRQFLTIHAPAGTVVHVRVDYPNGQHQSHKGKANGSGVVKYNYVQGENKLTPTKNQATVTVTATVGAAALRASRTYTILYGKMDIALEPLSQSAGKKVNLFVHTKAHVHVIVRIVSPNGRYDTLHGKTGPKGWAHLVYTVNRRLVSHRGVKLAVLASTEGIRPGYSDKASLAVK